MSEADLIQYLAELWDEAQFPTLIAEPDTRPGMEYNWHIVFRRQPHMRVAFMADAGDKTEPRAKLIVAAVNALPGLLVERATQAAEIERLRAVLEPLVEAARALSRAADELDRMSLANELETLDAALATLTGETSDANRA